MAQQPDPNGEFYYNEALKKAEAGDLAKALELFDKSIELKNDEYVAWYNRAIVKSMMGRYEGALTDLTQAIKLNPAYKKAYLNRGTAKKHLTDYGGAIQDFSRAIQLDSAYGEAYYNRGLVFELFDKTDRACSDFNKAKELGYARAEQRVALCKAPEKAAKTKHILWLTKTSDSPMYGFTPDMPVKVGTGPDGGPANERAYFDLLRDTKGNPVQYKRIGTCCGYKSDNAPKGLALLDKYEMTFINADGEQKIVYIYLTFYDYQEPEILNGFNTVAKESSTAIPGQ